jgi:hypothetical protein
MDKWIEQSLFKGRSPNDQKTHEEMLNIPGHKGNAKRPKPCMHIWMIKQ